ncbi:defensin-2-like [Ceratitis capitata]|uniref:defensin-2-like n=1 Tax=Ceratitis capitata TaxID=7213 RepID=UPI0006188D65|nr:defensin-2-like [Ceratitis capitata]
MKPIQILVGLIYLFCLLHELLAAPTDPFALELEEDLHLSLQQEQPGLVLHRQKRATCDLLSASSLSAALCNAHCFFIGKGSGKCNRYGVCECSK